MESEEVDSGDRRVERGVWDQEGVGGMERGSWVRGADRESRVGAEIDDKEGDLLSGLLINLSLSSKYISFPEAASLDGCCGKFLGKVVIN